MPVKSVRKKQACVAFDKTSVAQSAIDFHLDLLTINTSGATNVHTTSSTGIYIPDNSPVRLFLNALNPTGATNNTSTEGTIVGTNVGTLNDQIVVIAQQRNTVKTHLTQLIANLKVCEPPPVSPGQQQPEPQPEIATLQQQQQRECCDSLAALLYLYLNPGAYPVRKSMEWVVECLFKLQRVSKAFDASATVAADVLQTACKWILANYIDKNPCFSSESGINDNGFDLEAFMGWSMSFNCMANLGRDFGPWVSFHSEVLVRYMQVLQVIIRRCLDRIFVTYSLSADDEAAATKGSAEIIRYSECCGEAMRAVMNALKLDESAAIPNANHVIHVKWAPIIDGLMASAINILRSNVLHKDIVTTAAMTLICLQYSARFLHVAVADPTAPARQVQCILWLCDYQNVDENVHSSQTRETNANDERYSKLLHSAGLCPTVATSLPELPLQSKCGLLRACLSIYDSASLVFTEECSSGAGSLLMGPFLNAALKQLAHSLPFVRICGLQMLESWLNRVETILQNPYLVDKLSPSTLEANLLVLSTALTRIWSQQSKQITHIVPNVYQRLVQVFDISSAPAAVSPDNATDKWQPMITEALALPPQHRGRYQCLNVLLPKVGASRFLTIQPKIFDILIEALRLRDIASSASSFVVSLMRLLAEEATTVSSPAEEGASVIRPQWDSAVVAGLCASDLRLRENVADYLLKDVLAFDLTCGPHLIRVLRSQAWPETQQLWGLINICLQARLLTLPGKDIVIAPLAQASDAVTSDEIAKACVSEDDELRLTALTVLTASQRTCMPISQADYAILQASLKYSLKCGKADHRQRILRIVKSLLSRLFEISRVSSRDLNKLEKYLAATTVDASTSSIGGDKLRETRALIDEHKRLMAFSVEAFQWLSRTVLDNLYPGTTFEREVVSLEIVSCALEVLSAVPSNVNIIDPINSALLKTVAAQLASVFFTKEMTLTIINVALSSWDSSRSLASSILMRFPKPLPCYTTPDAVNNLLQWGFALAGSPRQRESDAGAFLIKTVMSIYGLEMHWSLDLSGRTPQFNLSNEGASSVETTASTGVYIGYQFVGKMCELLSHRLVGLEELFRGLQSSIVASVQLNAAAEIDVTSPSSSTALCHGLVNALHLSLSEFKSSGLLNQSGRADVTSFEFWRPLFQRILAVTISSLQTAMIVVAEASSDVPFAPIIASSGHNKEAGAATTKGPVNSSSYVMSATYVNTNSIVGSTAEASEASLDEGSLNAQRAVVAAWLLVKESTSLLAELVALSPPVLVSKKVVVVEQILTVEEISHAGTIALDALGRLKHMGAIAETHAALQSIASTLLRHGERSPELCRLPHQWLTKILSRLNNEQQVFILRRSAGFAYSFLSLLRSEPSNCKSTLTPLAMDSLLRIVEAGVDPELIAGHSSTESWHMSVHALNVTRLIILDAALSGDLDEYISRATMLAMKGFKSPHWAVRNSSMMVFSSIIQRAVSNDKNSDSVSSSGRSMTIAEFFGRYPALYPFLLAELSEISVHQDEDQGIDINASEGTAPTSNMNTVNLHPSLYPILLLLSKQRPVLQSIHSNNNSNEEDHVQHEQQRTTVATAVDVSPFVPLVESCSIKRYQQVRHMASKAILPLVSVDCIPATSAKILSDVLVSITKTPALASMNAVHGKLLLASELLNNLYKHCPRAENDVHLQLLFTRLQQEVTQTLLPVLDDLETSLSAANMWCPPVHLVFFNALTSVQEFLSVLFSDVTVAGVKEGLKTVTALVAGEALIALRTVVTTFATAIDTSKLLPYEPVLWRHIVRWLATNAVAAVNTQTTAANELLEPIVITLGDIESEPFAIPAIYKLLPLITHSVSEVREGLLLGFLDSFDKLMQCSDVKVQLLSALLEQVKSEKEPPILDLTLQLLSRMIQQLDIVSIPQSIGSMAVSMWDVFYRLIVLFPTSEQQPNTGSLNLSQTSCAGYCVEVLGWIVAMTADTNDSAVSSLVRQWVDMLTETSADEQDLSLRESTARSILISGVLAPSATAAIAPILSIRTWFVAVRLMQDDDADVRSTINRGIASLSGRSAAVTDYSLENLSQPLARQVGTLLSVGASSSVDIQDVIGLFARIIDAAAGTTEEARRLCALGRDGEALSQKIFEAEQANLFDEPIVTGQLIFATITEVAAAVTEGCAIDPERATELVAGFIDTLICRVAAGIEILIEAQEHISWIGGPSYQKDIFKFVYLSLSGLHMLPVLMDAIPTAQDHRGTLEALQSKAKEAVSHSAQSALTKVHPWITDLLS